MKTSVTSYRHLRTIFVCLLVSFFSLSCAATKHVSIWKDEGYTGKIESILIVGITKEDYIRRHFENVMVNKLSDRGIKGLGSHTLFPDSSQLPDRETLAAKVKELGIKSVMIARVISKKEHSQMISGGYYEVPVMVMDDWYNAYSGIVVIVSSPGYVYNYDSEEFNMQINLYDTMSQKLFWSDLLKVKVEGSIQGMVNPFIDVLIKDMESNRIIPGR